MRTVGLSVTRQTRLQVGIRNVRCCGVCVDYILNVNLHGMFCEVVLFVVCRSILSLVDSVE